MIPSWLADAEQVRYVHRREACSGTRAPWPSWLPKTISERLVANGIVQPWQHQVTAAQAAFCGSPVAIATGTASGKTLAYLLPIMAATACGSDGVIGVPTSSLRAAFTKPTRQHTALYLAPTKALAHDQLRTAKVLGGSEWRVTTLDGDSDEHERRYARDIATYVLTNPDMVHRAILPQHQRWASFLQSLRYIVVDESHRYRGVFGSQVAAVLRRLRRVCALYGASPVIICASATSSAPAQAAARLIGVDPTDMISVTCDSSAKPALDVVLWEPEMSLYADASQLLAQLVEQGKQTLAFVPSRIMAERVAIQASEKVSGDTPIVSYRAGYLAADRRGLEQGIQQGKIRGIAATNALELGIDISGMDAVVIAGFPGTLSSLWQQIGRAGRAGSDALAILVAKPDPLDAYLMEHPQLIFEAPVETTVMDPENPHILGPQLCAAAQEEPLTEADSAWFGPSMIALAERLAAVKLLRRRQHGWFWTKTEWAVNAIDLRSMSGKPFDIIDAATGRVLGQADPAQADKSLFPGAVYLHQGDPWLVDVLDHDTRQALVHADRPGYYTQAQGGQSIKIVRELTRKSVGRGIVCFGDIELTSRVTHYLRRDEHSNDVWDEIPVELPQRVLSTQALWWILPATQCQRLGLKGSELGAAAHAAEHTAIGLLAAFATCDRWDIGGLSTVLHEDTGECSVFVHDGHPGGAGFAKAGYERVTDWLAATQERLTDCACAEGCPACCVSPKCGNQNQHLDKAAGAKLLTILLDQ